jgi:hypothetical protein
MTRLTNGSSYRYFFYYVRTVIVRLVPTTAGSKWVDSVVEEVAFIPAVLLVGSRIVHVQVGTQS